MQQASLWRWSTTLGLKLVLTPLPASRNSTCIAVASSETTALWHLQVMSCSHGDSLGNEHEVAMPTTTPDCQCGNFLRFLCCLLHSRKGGPASLDKHGTSLGITWPSPEASSLHVEPAMSCLCLAVRDSLLSALCHELNKCVISRPVHPTIAMLSEFGMAPTAAVEHLSFTNTRVAWYVRRRYVAGS